MPRNPEVCPNLNAFSVFEARLRLNIVHSSMIIYVRIQDVIIYVRIEDSFLIAGIAHRKKIEIEPKSEKLGVMSMGYLALQHLMLLTIAYGLVWAAWVLHDFFFP